MNIISTDATRRNFCFSSFESFPFRVFLLHFALCRHLPLTMMRSLAFLIAALCLALAAPVMAVDERKLQPGSELESMEPSVAPPVEVESFIPTATPAPSLADEVGGEPGAVDSTSMPTVELTSASFKTATAVAGAATLCAFVGYF
jgi:hypothetical protein